MLLLVVMQTHPDNVEERRPMPVSFGLEQQYQRGSPFAWKGNHGGS